MMDSILIPRIRVEYFKSIKNKLKQLANLDIDIEDNRIYYRAEDLYTAKLIITAIARGFDCERALKLLNPDYSLYIIDLKDFFNTSNRIKVIKGRIIGREGSIKTAIETATDSYIAVFYDTISIISPYYSYDYVLKSINMLINGSKHSTLLSFLSRAKEYIKLNRLR